MEKVEPIVGEKTWLARTVPVSGMGGEPVGGCGWGFLVEQLYSGVASPTEPTPSNFPHLSRSGEIG